MTAASVSPGGCSVLRPTSPRRKLSTSSDRRSWLEMNTSTPSFRSPIETRRTPCARWSVCSPYSAGSAIRRHFEVLTVLARSSFFTSKPLDLPLFLVGWPILDVGLNLPVDVPGADHELLGFKGDSTRFAQWAFLLATPTDNRLCRRGLLGPFMPYSSMATSAPSRSSDNNRSRHGWTF